MNVDEKKIKLYLKKNEIGTIELMGIMGMLIISKDILKRNSEVEEFIKKTLELTFPEYVIRSRTLMSARVNRVLAGIDDESEIKKYQKNILEYLESLKEAKVTEEPERVVRKVKKENENDKLKKLAERIIICSNDIEILNYIKRILIISLCS